MRGLRSHPQKLYQKLLSIYAWPVENAIDPHQLFEGDVIELEV
jgi:hypothetical protein